MTEQNPTTSAANMHDWPSVLKQTTQTLRKNASNNHAHKNVVDGIARYGGSYTYKNMYFPYIFLLELGSWAPIYFPQMIISWQPRNVDVKLCINSAEPRLSRSHRGCEAHLCSEGQAPPQRSHAVAASGPRCQPCCSFCFGLRSAEHSQGHRFSLFTLKQFDYIYQCNDCRKIAAMS